MTSAGDPEESPESGENPPPPLNDRVAALELQVDDLNHQLDNLTTEFVRLRLKLESTRTSLEDTIAAAAEKPQPPQTITPIPFVPATPPPPVAAATSEPPPSRNLEERLGSQVFNAIGILAILCGASYGLKLAIEHGLIGPVGRILIGLAAGSGLILWSERFRRKGFAAFSYSLKGVGSALLYLSLWAAFHLYGLLPATAALVAMIVVTFWNSFMAWKQDAELLALYALLGGFLTPLLLSTGGDHEAFLFTYIAIIDLALVALLRTRPWGRLLWLAFPATAAYFIGWYSEFFHRATIGWDGQSTETAIFTVVFAALFAGARMDYPSPYASNPDEHSVPHSSQLSRDGWAPSTSLSVLLPLANAIFLGAALYSVFEDSGLHSWLPWIAMTLAAVYLGLMRLQSTAITRAVHLAIAVIFLTVAIPLKASGHTLTTAWLAEGLVLFWLSTRFSISEEKAARLLRGLSASGYALGLGSLCFHWAWQVDSTRLSFFTRELATSLIAVATLGGAIVIAAKAAAANREIRRGAIPVFLWAFAGINFVALLLTSEELLPAPNGIVAAAFANPAFGHALVGLAILAAAVFAAYKLAQQDRRGRDSMLQLTGVTLIIFNLAAILSIEREIGALFHAADAGLARSLAISAFLMLYGAALLAFGFWRRIAFIRWQALILLLFTIGKVFLYDTIGLSQGYRVASFVALGALLMTVSFAYQKDWLNLKNPPADTPAIDTPDEEAP